MSRVIQFRCFYRGVMYPVKEMQFGTDGSFSVSIIEMDLDDLGIRDVSPDSEHIEGLMQFTGLKDKTGAMIFESDIIQTIGSENTKIKHAIIFEDGGFCAKNLTYQNTGKLSQKWISELDFEVIGNIYEHKHLLK